MRPLRAVRIVLVSVMVDYYGSNTYIFPYLHEILPLFPQQRVAFHTNFS